VHVDSDITAEEQRWAFLGLGDHPGGSRASGDGPT
jgi:hypothetical protein